MRVAFVGLGTMGAAMAGHLLDAGHDVAVHNRTREREEALAERGARRAATPQEAAEGAELVFVCVSDSPDVEQVVLGEDGIVHGLAEGAVLVDCSTISPATSRKLAEELAKKGRAAVDAPVSGGAARRTPGSPAGGSAPARAPCRLSWAGRRPTSRGPAPDSRRSASRSPT